MKKDEPMRNINPFGLRMQPDLRAKVEEAAAQNHRSLNAEIVARLEESFDATAPAAEPPRQEAGVAERFTDEELERVVKRVFEKMGMPIDGQMTFQWYQHGKQKDPEVDKE